MDNPAPAKFTQGSTMRHVVVMTATAAFGLTFTFIIDLLALFWLSLLGEQDILAALAVAGAIMFATISLAIALMIPAVALVSRSLGRGEARIAREQASSSLLIATGLQILTAIIVLFALDPLLALVGDPEQESVQAYAREFLRIVLPSLPIFAVAVVASALLRAAGDGVGSMLVTLIGGAVAMVLDPIVIIWLDFGVKGAASVIVIARIAMAIMGLALLIRRHELLAPLRDITLVQHLRPYFSIAIPAMLAQLSTPCGNIIMTRTIAGFGEASMAGWAVNFRLMLVGFGGVFALSGAIGGIIGQNFGAGRMDRVSRAYLDAIKFGAIYTLCTWLVLLLLRPLIPAIFSLNTEAMGVVNMFVLTAWHFIFVSALFVSNAAFNNLGRPLWTTGFNWLRDLILTIPFVYLFARAFGAEGVVLAQLALGVVVGSLAGFVGWRFIARLGDAKMFARGAH